MEGGTTGTGRHTEQNNNAEYIQITHKITLPEAHLITIQQKSNSDPNRERY